MYFLFGNFLGTYIAQALLFSAVYVVYNSFETNIFKSLVDDVFEHVYRLPETFFANTFTGSIVSKINRARQKMEVFEDQILVRIFPTIIILFGSLLFLMMRFPLLAMLILGYLIMLVIISSILVFKVSGPAQGRYANAQDYFSAHLADSISGVASTKSLRKKNMSIHGF